MPFRWRGSARQLGASSFIQGRERQRILRLKAEDTVHRAPTSAIFASRSPSKVPEATQRDLVAGEVQAAPEAEEGRLGETLVSALDEALECFHLFDRDADGFVQASEVVDMLRSLGFILSHEQAKALEAYMRTNNMATVNFPTFRWMACQGLSRTMDPVEVLKAFYVLDRQKKESVNVEELHHLMTSVGDRLSEGDWRTLLKITVPLQKNQKPVALKSGTFLRLVCGPVEGQTACATTAASTHTPAPVYEHLR